MIKYKYFSFLLAILLFTQCELQYNDFEPSVGEADFSNFVSIGDSYTAGYTDGALGLRGQKNSFSYIISQQLKSIGSQGFNQPLVSSGKSIGTTEISAEVYNGFFELKIVNNSLNPVPTIGDTSIFSDRLYDSNYPIQNLGIPGAKSSHLLAEGYAQLNPYYARFASSQTSTVVADAVVLNPTFISLWIGSNDVLGYALEGGEADEITDPDMFENYMGVMTNSLFGAGTKGVMANIPNVETIPYFNYIKYNALEIDQATADALNVRYSEYNAISDLYGFDRIDFVAGANAFVIKDENAAHPAKIRQIKASEKILLSASSGITNPELGWGSKAALGEGYVLDAEEIKAILNATVKYNKTIQALCSKYNLAYVDLNALMNQANTSGVVVDGNIYTSNFISGGVFSLDGIHTVGRGSAIIANAFIKAINNQYAANIPLANINDYDGIKFP